MDKQLKSEALHVIDKANDYLDKHCTYNICNQVTRTDLTKKDVQRLANKLWNLGITDGIENDADSYKNATVNSINSDLDAVYASIEDGTFNGSFTDIHSI